MSDGPSPAPPPNREGLMPKHFEFVMAAYLISLGAFALYILHLFRKERSARRVLARLSSSSNGEESQP